MQNVPSSPLLKTALIFGFLLGSRGVLPAASIDSFEDSNGLIVFSENASTAISTAVVAGQTGNALQVTYDLSNGGFAGISRNVSAQDFITSGGANAVRLSYRAQGAVNTLETKFTDNDSTATLTSDKLVNKLTLIADNTWREVIMPFPSFLTAPDGNGVFSSTSVTHMTLGVTRQLATQAAGTVFLDNIELVRRSAYTAMVDDFETANLQNNRFLGVISFAGGATASSSLAYVTTQTVSGAFGLGFIYSVPGAGFTGFSEILAGLPAYRGTERLQFSARGQSGGEPLRIEVKSSPSVSAQIPLSNYGALTTAFQTFSIPLSDFVAANPALDLRRLSEFVFLVIDNAGSSRIYFDNIAVTGIAAGDATVRVLEDFSGDKAFRGYGEYTDPDTSLNVQFVKDTTLAGSAEDNRVGRLDYNFNASAQPIRYAVIERELRPNLLSEPVLRLQYKGTGANNTLEVKLQDADDTIFIRKLGAATNTGGAWRSLSLPVADFGLFVPGADSLLDLKRIKSYELVFSRGERAGGVVVLDELESLAAAAYSKDLNGDVVASIATPDNPFSPNGDGVKDTARFSYTLTQPAAVVLKIFNTRGTAIFSIDAGQQAAGSHVLEWDGRDLNARTVASGVYIFKLDAAAANGAGRDIVKQVIGVSK